VIGHLFGDDGLLGSLSIRDGKNRGHWRPGKRSTELAIAARRLASTKTGKHIKPMATGKKPAAGVKPVSTVARIPTAAPSKPVSTVARGVVASSPAAKRPPPAAKKPAPKKPTPSVRRAGFLGALIGACLDGLGDTTTDPTNPSDPTNTDPATADQTYTPNAKVWISTDQVQMYWGQPQEPGQTQQQLNTDPRWGGHKRALGPQDQNFDANQNPWYYGVQGLASLTPATYPDGTPIVGRIWLPKVNLIDADPRVYREWWRHALISLYGLAHPDARSDRDDMPYIQGDGSGPYEGYVYYGSNGTGFNGERGAFPASGGPQSLQGHFAYWDDSIHDKRDWDQWSMRCSFDWSVLNPTQAAYPWLFDAICPDRILGWVEQPADLWRSDGQSFSVGGSLLLAGAVAAPWFFHCVEFLDNLIAGAHGLPAVVDSTGAFNQQAFIDWCQKDPQWSQLVNVWNQGGAFMLATIYDNKPVVFQPPAPIAPDATDPSANAGGVQYDPTTGYPIDPNTGLPIDPNTNLPFDPTTGQYYDPSTGAFYDAGAGGGSGFIPGPNLPTDGVDSSAVDDSGAFSQLADQITSDSGDAGGQFVDAFSQAESGDAGDSSSSFDQVDDGSSPIDPSSIQSPVTMTIDGQVLTLVAYLDEDGTPYYVDQNGVDYDIISSDAGAEEAAA
jgi:hypothetical protein